MAGGDGGVDVPGLDTTFGEGGIVTQGFDGGLGGFFRVARQDDGKILAVGGDKETILVQRFVDGAIDRDFGRNGTVHIHAGIPSNGAQVGYGCLTQPDGKILVSGEVLAPYGLTARVGVVARLNSDGSFDEGFGDGGLVVGAPGSTASALALLDDGKILIASGGIQRRNPDGSVDSTFGIDGSTESLGMRMVDMGVAADGSILATGGSKIVRVTSAGAIDTSFGIDGFVEPGLAGGADQLFSLVIDEDGGFWVGGQISSGGNSQMWFDRYLASGAEDPSYGGGAFGAAGVVAALAKDSNARIVASGFIQIDDETYGRSARFDTDGNLDTTFGNQGVGAHTFSVLFSNLVFQDDGSFIAGGSGLRSINGGGSGFAPVLFSTSADGLVDNDIVGEGGYSFDRAQAVASTSDGKILVGGWATDSAGVAVMRLSGDGALDETFAQGGILERSDNLRYVSALAEGPGGTVLVCGISRDDTFIVERYSESGELDTSFGSGGVGGGELVAGQKAVGYNMDVASDGSIYVTGYGYDEGGIAEIGVIALDANGDRLSGFGDGGAALSAFGEGFQLGMFVRAQSDGKVVVLGLHANQPTMMRFNADGSVDGDFGTLALSEDSDMLPMNLAVQDDGAILAVVGDTEGNVIIKRVLESGAEDTGFGSGGVVTEAFGPNDYYGGYVAMGLTVLSDGTISLALAGSDQPHLIENGILIRYLSDGRRDPDYGLDGRQDVAIGEGSTSLHASALDAEGRLLVVGRTWTAAGASEFLTMRIIP